ncbi:hypothetical protein E1B28_010753 [Marasmius oreades]|uniref:RING-type domain-containing protein n=1 Tax=Marasmius oreades TaxID=181124 RepID=A0A9P7UPA3_9AGAR|nr:uncharacterized protein E1B28_010753 [Marasmius oreades]KAG7089043.1 hypothetical protein E1B28_010753 [Marasmius oreades]
MIKAKDDEAVANAAVPMEVQEELRILRQLGTTVPLTNSIHRIQIETEEKLAFIKKVMPSIICDLCKKAVCKPHIIDCGHAYCADCLWDHVHELGPCYDGKPVQCPKTDCRMAILYGAWEDEVLEALSKGLAEKMKLARENRGCFVWFGGDPQASWVYHFRQQTRALRPVLEELTSKVPRV